MNQQLKANLVLLLQLLLTLLRTPVKAKDEIEAVSQEIKNHQALINTAHGDSELNDPQVKDLIDDLTTVAAESEPDEEYAEIPTELPELEQAEPISDSLDAENQEEAEAEEPESESEPESETEEEAPPAPKKESPKERIARQKAEREAKLKKK